VSYIQTNWDNWDGSRKGGERQAIVACPEGILIMNKKIGNRLERIASDQAMADGLRKHKPQLPATMSVGSHPMTCDDVIGLFEDLVASSKSVQTAQAAHDAAIQADRDKRAAVSTTVTAARRLIVAMFLASPDTLGDFGLTAPKNTARTVDAKASAASKARETRKVLGTKGTRQKKAALAEHDAQPAATPAPAPVPAAPPAKPAS
jgi:hypothetical protein